MKSYTKRQLHKARGIRTWYLRTYEDGKTTYISLKTTSAKLAQEIVDRMNASRFFPDMAPAAMAQRQETDLRKAAHAFLDQVSTVTPKSIKPYTVTVDWFLAYCDARGIATMQAFTKAEGVKLVESEAATIKPLTLKNRVATISLLFKRTAQMEGMELPDPFDGVKLPKVEKREKDFWTMEQVAAIMEHARHPKMRMAWALMGYAGLRIHEAVKVEEKDLQGGELLVYGKGGKEARLPISGRLAAEIVRYREQNGGTFPAPKVHPQMSTDALSEACREAGVPEGSWCSNHKLRHSFASNLARSGCPVRVAMALLRHSSSAMTMDVYSHVLGDDLKEWAGKI